MREHFGSAGGPRKVILQAVIEQALLDTDRAGQRACRLSHRVTLWIVLAMGVLTDLPIRQVFKQRGVCS